MRKPQPHVKTPPSIPFILVNRCDSGGGYPARPTPPYMFTTWRSAYMLVPVHLCVSVHVSLCVCWWLSSTAYFHHVAHCWICQTCHRAFPSQSHAAYNGESKCSALSWNASNPHRARRLSYHRHLHSLLQQRSHVNRRWRRSLSSRLPS